MKTILIIGGYGNFGSYIAHKLAGDAKIRLIIAGRSLLRAQAFCAQLKAINTPLAAQLDINHNIAPALQHLRPDLVIHTSGPFQRQSYAVAQACIAHGCHYIDLADARSFVANIDTLDAAARAQHVAVISGASSVPCLSGAVLDYFAPRFAELREVDYGLSIAAQPSPGLATVEASLSYAGKPFLRLTVLAQREAYGWQDLHSHTFPEIGQRWLAACDVPDLDLKLFPTRYPALRSMRFSAGTEQPLQQLGLWALSWLVRWGVISSLQPYARHLLHWRDKLSAQGSSKSGFYVTLKGVDAAGNYKTERFTLIARNRHGPLIPCQPAIILALRLARNEALAAGARPCLGLITLADYLSALKELDITAYDNAQPINAANLST